MAIIICHDSDDGLRKKRSIWKLRSAAGQKNTFADIQGPLEELRKKYPTVGSRRMKEYIREHTKGKVQAPVCVTPLHDSEQHI